MTGATLERRLANYRAAIRPDPAPSAADKTRTAGLAQLLATAVDGEVVDGPFGAVVRCEPLTVVLPLDRERLARLPGQPPPDAPLVCLDTETTGLATAAGTMAFLVGLGWWEGERFRQAQLLLPDQPNELALLTLIEALIPRTAWLVTYNGRGFDWPLLVTRYRMARRDPPIHAGHLDLLPFVRRVFRHRMADARLRTVETELLNVARHEDVEGWQIPGRYLDFLRLGIVEPLVAVVRHNREDVRSLARLLSPASGGSSRRSTASKPHSLRHSIRRRPRPPLRPAAARRTGGGCHATAPTSAARPRRHHSPSPRPGSTRRGRRNGSASTEPACSAGWVDSASRQARGKASQPAAGRSPPTPGSRSPSFASTASAITRGRSTLGCERGPSSSEGADSRSSIRRSNVGSPAAWSA